MPTGNLTEMFCQWKLDQDLTACAYEGFALQLNRLDTGMGQCQGHWGAWSVCSPLGEEEDYFGSSWCGFNTQGSGTLYLLICLCQADWSLQWMGTKLLVGSWSQEEQTPCDRSDPVTMLGRNQSSWTQSSGKSCLLGLFLHTRLNCFPICLQQTTDIFLWAGLLGTGLLSVYIFSCGWNQWEIILPDKR